MAKLSYDLVSPERKLASGEADSVQLPGQEGDMTALPNHAPVVTTLRPGVVTVREGGVTLDYVVTGGFAELAGTTVAVLAEEAVKREDVTADWLAAKLKAAEALHEIAEGEAKILAALRVNDFKFLAAQMN